MIIICVEGVKAHFYRHFLKYNFRIVYIYHITNTIFCQLPRNGDDHIGLPKITSAYLILTHDCNMRCRYCFVRKNPAYMTYDTAKLSVDFLAKNAIEDSITPSIVFFGGEPLLCWEKVLHPLISYIRFIYGDLFNLSVTTNGILLDDERIDFLIEHNVSVMLSADGNRKAQSYNRPLADGQDSFDVLYPKLGKISAAFPEAWYRSTLIPETCDQMMDGVLLAEKTGFKNYFTMPDEYGDWQESDFLILKDQVRKFGDYFIDCCRSGKRPIHFTTFETCFSYITNINYAIRNERRRDFDCCLSDHRCGLGGGREVGIAPDGKIYSCQDVTTVTSAMDFFHIGDIFSGVNDMRRMELVGLCNASECSGRNCSTCKLDRICDGGCVVNNYLVNNDIRKVPHVHCAWYQILLNEAIRVMQELGADNEIFSAIWDAAVM